MLDLAVISILVLLVYFFIGQGLWVNVLGALGPILVMRTGNLVWAKRVLFTVMMWNVVEVLNHAIDDGLKNEDSFQCTPTVSTWSADQTGESGPSKSLTEKESPLNSSLPQTEDEKHHLESTQPLPSTDVQ